MGDEPWDPRFLDFDRPISADDPTMLHLTVKMLQPCLSARDLERVQSVIHQVPSLRGQLPRAGVRDMVLADGLRGWRPQLLVGGQRVERRLLCGGCGTFKDRSKMSACGRCKLVSFCDLRCQREGWSRHRVRCAAAACRH